MKHFEIQSETELDKVVRELLKMRDADIRFFALYGKMGSGKTAAVKAFCRELAVTEPAVSPTFAIVNEYRTANDIPVFHFDFYRIEKPEEVYDLGYEEYFYHPQAFVFAEWPELIEGLLPEKHIKVHITETADGKRVIDAETIEK